MKRVTVGLLLALCSATLLMGCGSGTDTVTADSAVEKSENATVDDAAEDESEDTSTGDENPEGTTSEGATADDADEEDVADDTAAQDELSDDQSENVDDEADKDTNKSGVRTEAKGLHISVNHMQGTLSEKKDSMFTINTADGKAYVFSFDKAPIGYDDLEDGDTVMVKYSGEQSEVEAFTGKVFAVKKCD